ncbi:MAG: hypothetical protein JXB38_01465 [Anaerolineales bacterium]|nr:hypothetical protein [Anaerolineales bacterium]
MTRYNRSELEQDWEFKIVRSATGAFKKSEVLQTVIQQEGMSGWRMVEKFDDSRVRFKRPVEAAKDDFKLPPGIDPYRTSYGVSEGALGATIGLSILGVVAVIVTIILLAENGVIF